MTLSASETNGSELLTLLENPDATRAATRIQQAIAENETVTVFGQSTVDYTGRASSEFRESEVMLILKADNTFLVHQREGMKPKNWQTRASSVDVSAENGYLSFHVQDVNPEEHLYVDVVRLDGVAVYGIEEEVDKNLVGTEEQMHKHLAEHPSLIGKGLTLAEREFSTGGGDVDLLFNDEDGVAVLTEVKRRKASRSSVGQLQRYLKGMEDKYPSRETRGVLAAPSLSSGAEDQIANEERIEFVEVSPILNEE